MPHNDAFFLFSCRIENEENHYRLHVSGFSGTVEDSFGWYHDRRGFSTPDTGNICAEISHSGWWFHQCFYANLNGVYYKVPQNTGYGYFTCKCLFFERLNCVFPPPGWALLSKGPEPARTGWHRLVFLEGFRFLLPESGHHDDKAPQLQAPLVAIVTERASLGNDGPEQRTQILLGTKYKHLNKTCFVKFSGCISKVFAGNLNGSQWT